MLCACSLFLSRDTPSTITSVNSDRNSPRVLLSRHTNRKDRGVNGKLVKVLRKANTVWPTKIISNGRRWLLSASYGTHHWISRRFNSCKNFSSSRNHFTRRSERVLHRAAIASHNKTGSASVLMPQYDVSYEITFSTSDLLLLWVIVFDREDFEFAFRASDSTGVTLIGFVT